MTEYLSNPNIGGLGHKFNSNCDTEVIIAAYQEWGCECFCRFNGMFAIPISVDLHFTFVVYKIGPWLHLIGIVKNSIGRNDILIAHIVSNQVIINILVKIWIFHDWF